MIAATGTLDFQLEGTTTVPEPTSILRPHHLDRLGLTNAIDAMLERVSAARVAITRDAQGVAVTIEDNGKGFVPETANAQHTNAGGFGLIGIAERARLLGSEPLVSSAPGAGTTIRLHFDLPQTQP